MVLAIDIGNSNIVFGVYIDGKASVVARVATSRHLEADQYAIELQGLLRMYGVESETIEGVIIASVVPMVTPKVVQAIAHFTDLKPMLLSLSDAVGMKIDIENPAELGLDILASSIAVRHRFPLPAVIVDMGTATKITALDKEGTLRGVAISPGLFLSLDALVGGTSLLRGIALEAPVSAIGRNTTQSMQSGLVLGTASMLDGMIDRFAAELGEVQSVVATGGGAGLVTSLCRHKIQLVDTLLLDGLYWTFSQTRG